MLILFQILVLIFSVMVHEISHGLLALRLGDTTARDSGRLSLNPLKHLDPFGSVVLPLLLAALGGPVFGWARPVPYNPMNLKNPKRGSGLIAAAGPISNLAVAIVFGLVARALSVSFGGSPIFLLVNLVIIINLALAIFNLIPIPPLDGSGVLFSLLPRSAYKFQEFLTRYGFFILILLIFSGLSFLSPAVFYLHRLITGISLM